MLLMLVGNGLVQLVLYTSLQLQIMLLQSTYTPHLQYLQSLEFIRKSTVELFCRNSQHVKTVGYFCIKVPSCVFDRMFDRILNATLLNSLLLLE